MNAKVQDALTKLGVKTRHDSLTSSECTNNV